MKEISLERKKAIIGASKDIKNFNKEMFDFLYRESKGCLEGENEFESAIRYLKNGIICEQVELVFKLREHIVDGYRIRIEEVFEMFPKYDSLFENLSFFLEGNYCYEQFSGFLDAIKNDLPKEKIALLNNEHLHPKAIEFFVWRNADLITPKNVRRVVDFYEELNSIEKGTTNTISNAIAVENFSDEQIRILLKEKEYDLLYKYFKAGLPVEYAKYCPKIFDEIHSCIIIEALQEKVDPQEIVSMLEAKNYDDLLILTYNARKERINKSFSDLLKKYS